MGMKEHATAVWLNDAAEQQPTSDFKYIFVCHIIRPGMLSCYSSIIIAF